MQLKARQSAGCTKWNDGGHDLQSGELKALEFVIIFWHDVLRLKSGAVRVPLISRIEPENQFDDFLTNGERGAENLNKY